MKLACVHCDRPTVETAGLPPGWQPDRLTLLSDRDIEAEQRQYDKIRKPGEPRVVVDWDAISICPDCVDREKPKPWQKPPGPKTLFD